MKHLCLSAVTLLVSMGCIYAADGVDNFEPCGIELKHISKTSEYPGDTFVMYGWWGSAQGEKLPGINKVKSHQLEVLSWAETKITVKIPEHLEPGVYKVGVYCNAPSDPEKGGAYGTHWVKFKVRQHANGDG